MSGVPARTDVEGWGRQAHVELTEQMAKGIGEGTLVASNFFSAHMQLLGFVNFVGQLPRHVDASLDRFSKILDEKEEPPSKVFQRGFDPFRPLVGEVLLTRAVDSFLTYISELLALVFREKPKALRAARGKLDVGYVLGFDSQEELREAIAEREVRRSAYSGMPELAKWFQDHLGFALIPDRKQRRYITRLVEKRNLITHHRGVIDHRYIAKCGRDDGRVGEAIDVRHDGAHGYARLAEAVWDIDARAADKWHLKRGPLLSEDQAGDQLSLAREAVQNNDLDVEGHPK